MKYDFYITGTIGCAYDWWTGQRGTSLEDVKRFLEENYCCPIKPENSDSPLARACA